MQLILFPTKNFTVISAKDWKQAELIFLRDYLSTLLTTSVENHGEVLYPLLSKFKVFYEDHSISYLEDSI